MPDFPRRPDIGQLTVSPDASLLAAMQQMDREGYKSLLLLEGERLSGLVSIGDIQRAIIRNLPLETAVRDVARASDSVILAHSSDDQSTLRQRMMKHRTAYMPVVSADGRLERVVFWDEMFPAQSPAPPQLPSGVPVVVMAGGFGSRLRPLTHVIPKPLVPIGEKTILETIIDRFRQIGPTHFFLTVNYKSDMIRFYMDSVADRMYTLEYIQENKPLGTAGSLSFLRNKLQTTFFVTNCDIVIEDDYAPIYEYHRNAGNDITLVASLKHIRIPYGTVESGADGELLALREKPELNYMINTGMYILEPHVLDFIPDDTFMHITDVIEKLRSNGRRVGVYPVSEKSWYDIGEWQEYQKIIDSYSHQQT